MKKIYKDRLAKLANFLRDNVPKKNFYLVTMTHVPREAKNQYGYVDITGNEFQDRLANQECGYAGCACGWGGQHQAAGRFRRATGRSSPSHGPDRRFGEMFGNRINILKYFEEKGRIELAFYDIYDTRTGKYLDWSAVEYILQKLELPIAPKLYEGPFSIYEDLKPLAHNGSKVVGAKDISEGWIIRPQRERWNDKSGRTILKYKTDEYLSL